MPPRLVGNLLVQYMHMEGLQLMMSQDDFEWIWIWSEPTPGIIIPIYKSSGAPDALGVSLWPTNPTILDKVREDTWQMTCVLLFIVLHNHSLCITEHTPKDAAKLQQLLMRDNHLRGLFFAWCITEGIDALGIAAGHDLSNEFRSVSRSRL